MKRYIFIIIVAIISVSVYSQDKPSVVATVDLRRYSGKWYEIARLPNFFERKLKCVSATYELRDDGRITVFNAGHYISNPEKTNSAKGLAWVPDKNSPGKLKVQFFWPFSGDYWIMELDKDYRYVLVGDPELKYLWILARDKSLDENIYRMLIQKAKDNGYDVSSIIKVAHDCN